MSLQRYIRVYWVLIRLNAQALIEYRSNFVSSVIGSISWGIFSFVSMMLITSNTDSVFGWRREEILLLTGAYNIVHGVFHTVFSQNFQRISRLVNTGQLDILLLKPLDSQFLASLWIVNFASIFRIGAGIIFIAYIVHTYSLHISLLHSILFGTFLFTGLVLMYSIWSTVITTTIWFTRLSNLVELMYTISGLSRMPREMYGQLPLYAFIPIIPLTFVIVTPVKIFITTATSIDIVGLIVLTLVFWSSSRLFWKKALKSYTSASS